MRVNEEQPILGPGAGDIEHAALLTKRLNVGRLKCSPGGKETLFASGEDHQRGLGALRAANGGHSDSPVFVSRPHLLGVQPGRHLEETGQGAALGMLIVVALRSTAQRTQVLEHTLGVWPPPRCRGMVAAMLVIRNESPLDHHRADNDMPDRSASAELSSHPLHCRAERCQSVASRLAAHRLELPTLRACHDQVIVVVLPDQRDNLVIVALPTPRRGAWTARRIACASAGLTSSVR